jgi:predicted metal-dependent hydrolase
MSRIPAGPVDAQRRRRLPHLPLPATTFVAGQSPRPPEGWYVAADRAEWFDYGCDLFDAGCFFEAHELWEQVWLAARAVGNNDDTRFVQGLIRLAASGVKWLAHNPASQRSHLDAARALLMSSPARRGLSSSSIAAAIAALENDQAPRLIP